MANFKLNQTGEQIQADLDLLGSNSATQGQVLTANGTGGASWQNASGGSGGGTQLYEHYVLGKNPFSGAYFIFASTSSLQFDGTNGENIPVIAYYRKTNATTLYRVLSIASSVIVVLNTEGGYTIQSISINDYSQFTDTVTPL